LFRVLAVSALAVSAATAGLVVAAGTGSATARPTKKVEPYYVSLGDSYSVGYQNPTLGNTSGFTGYVAKHQKMQLENFGCGGATTTSLFTQIGCPAAASAATDGVPYPTTSQVTAAIAFIDAHPDQVGLVTVSISGNDVTACAAGSNPIPCVIAAKALIATNVTNLVTELDAALTSSGDATAPIVGITYPDVILGDYLYPTGSSNPVLAAQSIVAFDDLINPTLQTAYTSVTRGAFVDVTSAPEGKATAGDDTGTFDTTTGAYTGPLVGLKGVGKVPAAVAEVCTITWYCNSTTFGDIHANTKGYTFIGKLIDAELASA
jgi:lysophospholipase L1-like esterase